jgi:uncharacterized membrane protein YfcA
MRRRFHPLRFMTWPRWYWYLMILVGCVVVSAAGAWLSAQTGLYTFRQMFVVTLVVTVTWNIGDLVRYDYKRSRKDGS